jgi:hypothetical protein
MSDVKRSAESASSAVGDPTREAARWRDSASADPLPPPVPPPIASPEQFARILHPTTSDRLVDASTRTAARRPADSPVRRSLPDQLSRPVALASAPVRLDEEEVEEAMPAERIKNRSWFDFRPLQQAPPWLISLLMHMAILLLLGLMWLPKLQQNVWQVTAVFAETLGVQTEIDTGSVEMEIQQPTDPVITPQDLPPVESPKLEPQPVEATAAEAAQVISDLAAPDVGLALSGREAGSKAMLLAAYGGTALTESAVTDGLEWLRRNQQKDGTWKLDGPYGDGATVDNPTAATAMALLAFQGAGHTHRAGKYRTVVNRGIRALVKMQNREGDFFQGSVGHHRLYSQAQATIAVCELYGMTNDSSLRLAAERAVDYAVKAQDSLGGWRYQPAFDSDTSVTGWFMMALQSARMAGLEVPSDTLQRVSSYLDRAGSSNMSRYAYQPGMEPTHTMTAEALLCRQYLGWPKTDPRMKVGLHMIAAYPLSWEDRDAYYWYYATQVLHHLHDEQWTEWNKVMRELLPQEQTKSGPERGSWTPLGDRWGSQGGRLYVTCLHLFMLEVYYRHLPIYK